MFRPTHRTITVGTSSIEALPPNPSRTSALFVNISTQIMYLGLDQVSASERGIQIRPNGGNYEINAVNMFKGRVYAIAGDSGCKLLVTEVS